jgi:hypothetical protein
MRPQKTRRALGVAGLLELSCGEADTQDSKPNRAALQARNRMRRQRLVEHLHRRGPSRIEVMIAARDGPAPIGRTRPLKLTEAELVELIEFVLRLEARRA